MSKHTTTRLIPGELIPTSDGLCWAAHQCHDPYGESWTTAMLLEGEWTEEDVALRFNFVEHYGGPGRGFSRRPYVEFNGHSTLVRQCGGLDV